MKLRFQQTVRFKVRLRLKSVSLGTFILIFTDYKTYFMRKISLLLLALFAIVGGSKLSAQTYTVSDAPTDGAWAENTHWYTIKNGVSASYLSTNSAYTDDSGNIKLTNSAAITTPEGYWCVVASGDGVQFYNYFEGTTKVLGMTGSEANGRANMYDKDNVPEGVTTVFYYVASTYTDNGTATNCFRTASSGTNYWNFRSPYLAFWNSGAATSGSGSGFLFTEVSDDDISTAVSNVYTSYSTDVNTAVTTWTGYADKLFCHTTEQINTLKASIPATEPTTNDEKLSATKVLKAALNTFNASSYIMPEAGKHYALKNCNYNTYLYMPAQESSVPEGFGFSADSQLHGKADLTLKSQIWTVEESNGKYYIKNDEFSKKLSGTPGSGGAFGYSDEGTAYTLYPNDGNRYGTAAIGHGTQYGKMHLDGSNNLVAWETAQASSWSFIEVSDEDYNNLESVDEAFAYKAWGAALPVTNDAYTTALAAYNENASDENLAALKSALKACSYIRVKSMHTSTTSGQTSNTLGTSTDGTKGQSWDYSESNAGLIWQLYPVFNCGTNTVSNKLLNLNTGKCLSTVPGGSDKTASMETIANGATYSFTKQTSGDGNGGFAIKDGDGGQMYCETNGNINKWWSSTRAFWYITPATSLDVALTTVGDKAYATVYLPFAISSVESATAYKGANSADKARVDMTEVSQLAANNGYLLVGESGATAKLSLTGEVLTETDNILTGTLTALTLTDDTRSQYRVFGRTSADDATTLGFNTPAESLTTLAANKAFITETSSGTSAAQLVLNFNGNVVEGIGAATIDAPAADAPVYDLSGRRVAKAAKGLYIKGGKKILVK